MSESAGRKKYFTKHLFRAGLQCPTKLYYYANNYPQDGRIRPFIEHAGYNKHQLKALVRGHYPEGVQINKRGFESSYEKTKTQLEASSIILFDALFLHEQRMAKTPLLIKEEQAVGLYFIQTKVINPNKHRLTNHTGHLHKKWKQYIYDAAYQLYIIQQCFPEWDITPFLLLPDKTATARLDKLNQQLALRDAEFDEKELLHQIDISRHVQRVLENQERTLLPEGYSFLETLEKLSQRYFKGNWNPTGIGLKCKGCEFRIAENQVEDGNESGFNKCWEEAASAPDFSPSAPHVFDLIGPGVSQLVDKEIYLQKQVPLDGLPDLKSIKNPQSAITHKQRQALQVMQAKGKAIPDEIIKNPLVEEIGRWEYPLHFLDFEAGNYAVPIRKGRPPYHLVIFQFSCHTMYRDGSIAHHEWIANGQDPYPNYELVRQLKQVPDINEGTIIQYSNFERTALKIIRKELDKEREEIDDAKNLIDWLETIIQRRDSNHSHSPYLADLSRLVKLFYYNRYMADSLSIKDVVQSVLTLSDRLKNYYEKDYKGSNFDAMQWWQWDRKKSAAQNPYQLLRSLQSGVKVGRGTEAMVSFGKILSNSLRHEQKEKAIAALLQYCELDTLAMVMIYQHWQELDRNH